MFLEAELYRKTDLNTHVSDIFEVLFILFFSSEQYYFLAGVIQYSAEFLSQETLGEFYQDIFKKKKIIKFLENENKNGKQHQMKTGVVSF